MLRLHWSGNGSGAEHATDAGAHNAKTMIHLGIGVNWHSVAPFVKGKDMRDRKVTPDMVPVIKLARALGYNYVPIASYFRINQGRIADVMMGRLFPDIPPADELPADFPVMAAAA